MRHKNIQIKLIKDFYEKAKDCQKECGFTTFNALLVAALNSYMRESHLCKRVGELEKLIHELLEKEMDRSDEKSISM